MEDDVRHMLDWEGGEGGYLPGIGTQAIKFVNEHNPGNLVSMHLSIHSESLALDTRGAAHYHDGSVQNAKSTFHFNYKPY